MILGTVAVGLSLVKRFDCEVYLDSRAVMGVVGLAVGGSRLLGWICGWEALFSRLLLSIVFGCLLLACITDLVMCQVYNFVWWISGVAVGGLLWRRWEKMGTISGLGELLIFCAVQLFLFSRFYGRADCYAFCVCAGAEGGLGMGIETYVIHMVISYVLLLTVQVLRNNIGAYGRLKIPVPFLPYVTAGFVAVLIFRKICGEIVVPLS